MIYGIGTDLVEATRIARSLERYGERFAKRILTDSEWLDYSCSSKPVIFLANRFAAKEAAAKALGTGIGRGVSFQHIHIDNDENGAPILTFTDGAKARLELLNGRHGFISIADELHYAVATVILES